MDAPILSVIGEVVETHPIEGADRIHQAVVDCGACGRWSGVVDKGVGTGQRVTVFLQDALLPPDPRWAFMERHHWRVRMARFWGCPSECLIVGGAPEGDVGTDLTQRLGVQKYQKPIPVSMAGDAVGTFPSSIPKTDEINFQAVADVEVLMSSDPWYATEKVDGTSCTVWNDDSGLRVCSRNWELKEFTQAGTPNVYWQVARKYGLDRLHPGLALQVEIVGPGIQKNPLGLSEIEARAFSLYDIDYRVYLPVDAIRSISAEMGIPPLRIIAEGESSLDADALRRLAEIRYANGKPGEGIVIRAKNQKWSFKVLNLLYKD